MVTIINYGMGNLGSIFNMLKKIGVSSIITSDPEVIAKASRIILPGVGHFDRAIERINELGIREVLDQKALKEKVPLLGICLGMQLLTHGSEEGVLPGLRWIDALTKRFSPRNDLHLKVPHMGWNDVSISTPSPLTEGFTDDFRFYFVHSYHVCVENEKNSALKTEFGIKFDSAIQSDNIFGTQFHPEKSHKFGMKLLNNFTGL